MVTRAGGSSPSHTEAPLTLLCSFVATPLDRPRALLREVDWNRSPLCPANGGNPIADNLSETQEAAKARREDGRTTSPMMRAGTASPTAAAACRAAFGAKGLPPAQPRQDAEHANDDGEPDAPSSEHP